MSAGVMLLLIQHREECFERAVEKTNKNEKSFHSGCLKWMCNHIKQEGLLGMMNATLRVSAVFCCVRL